MISRTPRSSAFRSVLPILATVVVLGGCRGIDPSDGAARSGRSSTTADASANRTPPNLSLDAILAPIERSGYRELLQLEREQMPSARLRRAHILAQTHRSEEALTLLNGMLYGSDDPGPAVRAFAHFLRAEIFEANGETARAKHERQTALTQASNQPVDPALRRRLGAEPTAPSVREVGKALGSIAPRVAWSARPASGMDPLGKVTRITVHHSGIPSYDASATASVAAIRAIQQHHQGQNGWSDIGYHFLIDVAGRIWEGRDIRWQGAHAGDTARNRGNVGICLLGNFVTRSQRPSTAQIAALEGLIGALMRQHGLDYGDLLTHRELNQTTCPGPWLQLEVDRMRTATAVGGSE